MICRASHEYEWYNVGNYLQNAMMRRVNKMFLYRELRKLKWSKNRFVEPSL
ncbi:hypothetical protein JCM9140_1556 [Halalkalibacter wakoensis JCM 9140]|uniref:Uncharacterized protein n=1 Tax=Halalkalibacter wakoensis JCM 9140 TaxID=1236970 RepID=W4Q0F2_9BACI|nr:hypothetical protein JCM9140_1556 [Halalkalibacter wakoensis JCM 9140]